MTARRMIAALGLSLALGVMTATATGCSSDPAEVGTGGTSAVSSAGSTAPGSSVDPSTSISLPENCREVPATTGPGGASAGGGEIVCTEQPGTPGAVPGSPGDPDAPVSTDAGGGAPAPVTTTTFAPDDTHGVLQGTAVGGIDCAPNEACVAMAVIMDGTVTATPAGGGQPAPAEIDENGTWGLRLAPGTYELTVQVSRGECDPQTATVDAGLVTEVNLTCVAPLS